MGPQNGLLVQGHCGCYPTCVSSGGPPPAELDRATRMRYAIGTVELGVRAMRQGVFHERTVERRDACRDMAPRGPRGSSSMRGGCADMKCGGMMYGRLALAAALTIVVGGLSLQARAETAAYDLVIQRSPLDAGDVTPSTGAHRISANSTVTLTANPQPGYRFAYWLGDVSDPAAERTTITVDESKIVVAVFHCETQKRIEEQVRPAGAGGGLDVLAMTATDLSAPGWSPAGGAAKGDTKIMPTIVPVHTPEPATVALLAFGALVVRRRRP